MNDLIQKIAELIDVLKGRGANYYDGYQGIGHSSAMPLAVGDEKRLPPHKCKFVRLHRWHTSDDEAFTLDSGIAGSPDRILEYHEKEVYYGFDGQQSGLIKLGQSTDLLPVNNTNQITVRLPAKNAAGAVIYFDWFV